MNISGIEDASTAGVQTPSLVAAMRRLAAVAERAAEPEPVRRCLAHELMGMFAAEEVVIHHLAAGAQERDLVAAYLFDGQGRLSYLSARAERPPAISWVVGTGRCFLAVSERELLAGMPRLARGPAEARCALFAPLSVGGSVEAVVVLASRQPARFQAASFEQVSTLLEQAATAIALVRARIEAGTDAVAGCMNHRAMLRRLQEETQRAQRTQGKLSCMMIDLDDFKLLNDLHGHATGDAALRNVAATLMGQFRAFDRVARYGGDEFVVILPDAALPSATVAAERAIDRLSQIRLPGIEGIGASIGVAEWSPGMSVAQLLASCDSALLQGKRSGKARATAAR